MSNFIISFEEDAKIDLADSFDSYSNISTIVAENFLIEISKTISYLEENPLQFKIIYKDFRQSPLKKYPFVLLYKIDKKQVKVYRVFATSKNPKKRFK